jgi:hypothetical protein
MSIVSANMTDTKRGEGEDGAAVRGDMAGKGLVGDDRIAAAAVELRLPFTGGRAAALGAAMGRDANRYLHQQEGTGNGGDNGGGGGGGGGGVGGGGGKVGDAGETSRDPATAAAFAAAAFNVGDLVRGRAAILAVCMDPSARAFDDDDPDGKGKALHL